MWQGGCACCELGFSFGSSRLCRTTYWRDPLPFPLTLQTLISALEQLYNLAALDEEGLLTRLGRKMAEFPLDPPVRWGGVQYSTAPGNTPAVQNARVQLTLWFSHTAYLVRESKPRAYQERSSRARLVCEPSRPQLTPLSAGLATCCASCWLGCLNKPIAGLPVFHPAMLPPLLVPAAARC